MPLQVIVIGAGPVGASTAYGLRKRGFDVTIYDRTSYEAAVEEAERTGMPVEVAFGEVQGGTISLYTNGLNALRNLGLFDAVNSCPHINVKHFSFHKIDGSDPITHYATSTTKGHEHKQFLRSNMHVPIMRECMAAGIKIVLGKKVVSVDQDDQGVTAHFEDGTTARADVLIGADGVHSRTRSSIFPNAPRPKPWTIGYIGVFHRLQDIQGEVTELDGDMLLYVDALKGNIAFCGNASDKVGGFFIVEAPRENIKSDDESYTSSEKESWRPYTDLPKESKRLAVVVEQWGVPNSVVSCVRHAYRISPVTIYDLPNLPTFHSKRVILLGDAAHGTIPTVGQGLCTGLEDAAALYDLFGMFPAEQYETVFELFDKIRLDRIADVYANARGTASRMVASSPAMARFGRFVMRSVFGILRFLEKGDSLVLYDYRKELKKVVDEYKAKHK
ncbi:hypothetical protein HDU83_002871 [Entophlyctis luteolus]|nr:hypothetical protein HDU82_006881 [Entophlyctis luteolus]KAJ3346551.1 hypothetical protein HDU83_002871 [Entophlyctis luteolus]